MTEEIQGRTIGCNVRNVVKLLCARQEAFKNECGWYEAGEVDEVR